MDQPLGMLVAGQSAPKKIQLFTFLAIARNFICAPESFFQTERTLPKFSIDEVKKGDPKPDIEPPSLST